MLAFRSRATSTHVNDTHLFVTLNDHWIEETVSCAPQSCSKTDLPNSPCTDVSCSLPARIADPMVGYWCRVGSRALTHTHNDVAILAQAANIAQHLFCYFPSFSLPSMSFVFVAAFLLSPSATSFRLSTVEREPVLFQIDAHMGFCSWLA